MSEGITTITNCNFKVIPKDLYEIDTNFKINILTVDS